MYVKACEELEPLFFWKFLCIFKLYKETCIQRNIFCEICIHFDQFISHIHLPCWMQACHTDRQWWHYSTCKPVQTLATCQSCAFLCTSNIVNVKCVYFCGLYILYSTSTKMWYIFKIFAKQNGIAIYINLNLSL